MATYPSVTFLGTRFEGLRISGHLVEPKMVLDICGNKPPHDRSLFGGSGVPRSGGTADQGHREHGSSLTVGSSSTVINSSRLRQYRNLPRAYAKGYESTVKCSVVKSVGAIPSAKSYGNILQIPDFGYVALGVLEVEQTWSKDGGSPDGGVTTYFDLTMLDITMGSIAEGTIQVANVGANGHNQTLSAALLSLVARVSRLLCGRDDSPQAIFDRTYQSLSHGEICKQSRDEAKRAYQTLPASDSDWASKFKILKRNAASVAGPF